MNAHWFTYQPIQAVPPAWLLSLDAPIGSSRFVGSLSREMKFGGWVYVYSDWITSRDKMVCHADTPEDDAELMQAQAIALKIATGLKLAKDAPKAAPAPSVNLDALNGFIRDNPVMDGLSADLIPCSTDPLNGFFPENQPDNGGF